MDKVTMTEFMGDYDITRRLDDRLRKIFPKLWNYTDFWLATRRIKGELGIEQLKAMVHGARTRRGPVLQIVTFDPKNAASDEVKWKFFGLLEAY